MINHNTRVLKGVSGEHKLIDGNMISREKLFAGNMAVFIDSEALATHDNDSRMLHKETDLFVEAARHGNVIGVHASNKKAFGHLEAEIAGVGDLEVDFIVVYLETIVYLGVLLENLERTISRSVINGNDLKMRVGLVTNALESLDQVFFRVVDRKNDGDKRIMIS